MFLEKASGTTNSSNGSRVERKRSDNPLVLRKLRIGNCYLYTKSYTAGRICFTVSLHYNMSTWFPCPKEVLQMTGLSRIYNSDMSSSSMLDEELDEESKWNPPAGIGGAMKVNCVGLLGAGDESKQNPPAEAATPEGGAGDESKRNPPAEEAAATPKGGAGEESKLNPPPAVRCGVRLKVGALRKAGMGVWGTCTPPRTGVRV
jgi:hypothetical protein